LSGTYLKDRIIELSHFLGDEIIASSDIPDEGFEMLIKRGGFIMTIRQINPSKPLDIIFPFTIKDPQVFSLLDSLWSSSQFRFGLLSALSSPITQYAMAMEEGKFRGFYVITRLFPTHHEITPRNYDSSLKSVVSVGALAMNYFHTIFGDKVVEQQIIEDISQSTPENMFM
jgi:hypothetical protein